MPQGPDPPLSQQPAPLHLIPSSFKRAECSKSLWPPKKKKLRITGQEIEGQEALVASGLALLSLGPLVVKPAACRGSPQDYGNFCREWPEHSRSWPGTAVVSSVHVSSVLAQTVVSIFFKWSSSERITLGPHSEKMASECEHLDSRACICRGAHGCTLL